MKKANQNIREAAKSSGVYLWEIAERLNLSESWLVKKLRRELPDEEQERILSIIAEIAGGRGV